ncbi:MAG: hypothetical protein ACOC31_04610 [Bacteroidota bacterium]
MQIKDIGGKTVIERKIIMSPVLEQDISGLTSGIYMILLHGKNHLLAKEVFIKK